MFRIITSVALVILGAVAFNPALASHPDTKAEAENIKERRTDVTEEDVSPLTLKLGDSRFTLHGLIEVEAQLNHVEGGRRDRRSAVEYRADRPGS